ncbi:MAG: DEAD/DEAH box helicase [Bowdeniella nasicola]|nr:DEAD/DEAH box helicase [Bowdeniella nasicola]
MKIGLQRATWVRDYPESTLSSLTTTDTLQRASATVAANRVRTAVAAADGQSIMATVRPLTSKRVEHVRVSHVDGQLSGTCSCQRETKRGLCQHQLAVILAARADQHRGPEDQQLRPTTNRPPHQPGDSPILQTSRPINPHRKAVGLEVDLVGGEHVMLRPLRPTGVDKWRASGNGWRDFTNPHGVRWASEAQADAIFDLYQLFLSAERTTFAYGSRKVFAETLSAQLWPALRAAVAAGVSLIGGTGLANRRVVLAEEAITPHLDVTRRDDGALAIEFTCATAEVGTRMIPLGRPMHGVLIVTKSGARLQPFITALPPAVRHIAAAGVRYYPRTDVARALAYDIPRLALHLPLRSSDDSVALPQTTRPDIYLSARLVADTKPHIVLTWQVKARGIDPQILAEDIAPEVLRAVKLSAPQSLTSLLPTTTPEVIASEADELSEVCWRTHAIGEAACARVRTELFTWAAHARGIRVVGQPLADIAPTASATTVDIAAAPTNVATSQAAWLDLDIQVRIDGQIVPFELVFRALVSDAEQLYLPGGQWVDLTTGELDALRTLLAATKDGTEADVTAGRVSVSSFDSQAARAVEILGGSDDARTCQWIANLQELTAIEHDDGALELKAPINAELRDYQRRGVTWALTLVRAGLGGILADDMGLGKTLQLLAVIAEMRATNPQAPPVLVIAPTSVISGWVEQGAQFTPQLRIHALSRSLTASGQQLEGLAAGIDVLVTSYALARIDAQALADYEFSLLLLDEAQFVKNPAAKTFHAIRDIPARTVIAMTGTPLENSLLDLWAIFTLVAPGLLGTKKQFHTRFRQPLENDGGDERARQRAHHQLHARISPFMLRRTKSEVASELPAKQEQILAVHLSEAHRERYERQLQIERQHVLGLLGDADRNRVRILKSLTILRRLALDPQLAPAESDDEEFEQSGGASAKTDTLLRYVREVVAEGHRVLVFSQFTTYLHLIAAELDSAGMSYCYLDGATRNRAGEIERFRAGTPIFLISLKAGGFGLNLTEADYVFMMDPWWNPAVEEQAIDRTHRIGQTRPVNVYRLVATGTIEEKVLALQERKRQLFADVIGDGQAFGRGKLSAEDIRSLLEED